MGGPKDCNPPLNKVPWGSPDIKPFSRLPEWRDAIVVLRQKRQRDGVPLWPGCSLAGLLPALTLTRHQKRRVMCSFFKKKKTSLNWVSAEFMLRCSQKKGGKKKKKTSFELIVSVCVFPWDQPLPTTFVFGTSTNVSGLW